MKKFGLIVLTLLLLSHTKVFSAPVVNLPIDSNDLTEIGSGTYNTVWQTPGTFLSYDITDIYLTVLAVKIDPIGNIGVDDRSFGAIQLYNGATQILIPFVAASEEDLFKTQSPNTWYIPNPSSDADYAITRAASNGNANYAGDYYGTRQYYIYFSDTTTYYVGFESPVYVTEVKLGTGGHNERDYQVDFYAYGAEPSSTETIPEPTSIVLLGLGVVGLLRKIKRK